MRPFRCVRCGKRFTLEKSGVAHVKQVHARRGGAIVHDPREEEESLADIAVGASIKRFSGEALDPLEASLIGDCDEND